MLTGSRASFYDSNEIYWYTLTWDSAISRDASRRAFQFATSPVIVLLLSSLFSFGMMSEIPSSGFDEFLSLYPIDSFFKSASVSVDTQKKGAKSTNPLGRKIRKLTSFYLSISSLGTRTQKYGMPCKRTQIRM